MFAKKWSARSKLSNILNEADIWSQFEDSDVAGQKHRARRFNPLCARNCGARAATYVHSGDARTAAEASPAPAHAGLERGRRGSSMSISAGWFKSFDVHGSAFRKGEIPDLRPPAVDVDRFVREKGTPRAAPS